MASVFRINNPPVVAETLDGEATIVDLEAGIYYALNESGSFIWEELDRGSDLDEIAAGLRLAYDLGEETARQDVEALVDELRERNLISRLDDGAPPASPTNGASPAANGGGTYAAPELSTYTDMQELLLLDPVHEVDDSGWPNRP